MSRPQHADGNHTDHSQAKTRRSSRRPRRTALASFAWLVAVLLLVPMPQAFADDTELLRANSSNPFLFIVLDNSRSMAASIDDQPGDVVWASMGAIGPNGSVNLNDYFWNRGSVGPDIEAGAVTGWWYLRGVS